jgi:hypothetical protein
MEIMQVITQVRQVSVGVDQYGEPIFETSEMELFAKVAARTGSKTIGPAEITITSGLTVYLDAYVDIQNDDVFIYLGDRYVLDGESFNWINGLGSWSPGTVIDLQREIYGK